MSWQVNYALKYISEIPGVRTAQHLRDEAILITMPNKPEAIAVISAATLIEIDIVRQYYLEYPEMDFLCGYRKECVWEGR
jgi:hypothetical protein